MDKLEYLKLGFRQADGSIVLLDASNSSNICSEEVGESGMSLLDLQTEGGEGVWDLWDSGSGEDIDASINGGNEGAKDPGFLNMNFPETGLVSQPGSPSNLVDWQGSPSNSNAGEPELEFNLDMCMSTNSDGTTYSL